MQSFSLFKERLDASFALMESKGIKKINYSPPLFRLYWALKLQVRPPHFTGFLLNFYHLTIYFSVIWGCSAWALMKWLSINEATTLSIQTQLSITVGTVLGVTLATYFMISRNLNTLPDWREITPKAHANRKQS